MTHQLPLTNALTKSLVRHVHKIKETTNFPLSLITQIEPSLQNKFKITKELTKYQQWQYQNLMKPLRKMRNALIIESEDQSIIDQVIAITRNIHHHSELFHLSQTRSISKTPRPTVNIFRDARSGYKHKINEIAANYNCTVWFLDTVNKFGIFCLDEYHMRSCISDIRIYVNSVMDSKLDFIRINEVYKTLYFSKTNVSLNNLNAHCAENYKDTCYTHIKNCDRGYIWIYSKNKKCRKYIKQFIENDIYHNWLHKYVDVDDSKLGLLFGRQHNNHTDCHAGRYNEFGKMFAFDEEEKCNFFYNETDRKCRFYFKYIPDRKNISHKLCIVIHVANYNDVDEAKEALNDICMKINRSLDENVEMLNVSPEYQCVLNQCFANDIHWTVLFGNAKASDRLYVKHDNNGHYAAFKSLIYDRIIPNSIIIDGITSFNEANVLRTLLANRMSKDNLKLIQTVKKDDEFSIVIYDEKLVNKEYQNNVKKIIETVQQTEMDMIHVGEEYMRIIVGANGEHLNALLKHCQLDDIDRKLISSNDSNVYFGINSSDKGLLKLKSLIQKIIDNCNWIELSPKEWKYIANNWNRILIQKEFPQCCISLRHLTADRMLFYGSEKIRKEIIHRIKLAVR